ncbi:MAG: hypothetical protein J1E02_01660 [Coprobacter sp.]|nr:hypothetical protein [Coprobacter sp.]
MKYAVKSTFLAGFMMLFASAFVSCTKDDPNDNGGSDSGLTVVDGKYHFDIWVAVDKHGGMGRDVKTIVRSVSSLDASQPAVSFVGDGTEVNATMTMESIVKDAYYYQVPVSEDRFSKYVLTDNEIVVVQEQPFEKNTYSSRKYTHAWLDDHTLVIMAADGDAEHILWTKLNADDMRILEEGTLDLPFYHEKAKAFTTSGILAYRKADNKLIYFYYEKNSASGRSAKAVDVFRTVIINPSDMTVERNTRNSVASEMAGSSYGELLQKCTFFDEAGNLYLACFSCDDAGNETESHLLRIKAGETDFDPDYDGFNKAGHKLIAIEYLGNGKVLAYARETALGTGIDDYSHYYSVIDIHAGTNEKLTSQGSELPYCGGRFSQRMVVHGGKGYIGIAPEVGNPCIYIYDSATGTVEKGVEVQEGFYFEQIRVLSDVE